MYEGESAGGLLDRILGGSDDPTEALTELAMTALSNALQLTYDIWDANVSNATAAMNAHRRAMELINLCKNAGPKQRKRNPYAVQKPSAASQVRRASSPREDESEDVQRVERRNPRQSGRPGKKVAAPAKRVRQARPPEADQVDETDEA